MARIRSVHPGLFTDADFAYLGDSALMFYIGLLTQADDQGMFEWKPRELKLRIRPGKDGPVEPLLDELLAANRIRRVEIDGVEYGAIRNFRRWQKPKSPNAVYPITDDLRKYVGLSDAITEMEGDEADAVPQDGENASQREEGGGNRRRKSSSLRSDDYPPEFAKFWSAMPKRNGSNDKKAAFKAWNARLAEGYTAEEIIAGATRYAAWCRATKKENTETVKQAATFLEASDPPHFTLDWRAPGQQQASAPATEIASHHESLTPWLPKLRQCFDIPTINSWFVQCRVIEKDDWITLAHPNAWAAKKIQSDYGEKLAGIFGPHFQIGHGIPQEAAA